MTQTDRITRKRKSLMMSCASVALATAALFPQAAHAQALGAFRGDITGTSGSVNRNQTSNTTETITIGSTNATINWRPTDHNIGGGDIDFLPNGNTATFTSSQGITDYTVLNRILPDDSTRGIALNGHVISTLQGTQATGGRIWFYAPGGILIGSTAVVDVGSLLLTTNDVTSWGTSANGFNATFAGPASSTSRIRVENGAQINALQQGSYIAMIAPRVEQAGKVRVNGSAAYVAGEQLAMTMNQGLFDIQVDVGTTDANGIVHTGETSGPANTAAGDNHSIYMVAVPKNQALTMLLSGKVGFDDAVSASVENGQIVLASGYNVQGGSFVEGDTLSDSNIGIHGGSFTSDVEGRALGAVTVGADETNIDFAGDLRLLGRTSVDIAAEASGNITVGGNLQVASFSNRAGESGFVQLLVDGAGSAISVAGTTELRADFFNLFTDSTVNHDQSYTFFADTIPLAGTVTVQASNGGHATFNGATDLGAEGLQTNGASASGGSVEVLANSGGTIDFNSDVHMDTTSFGGYPTNGIGGEADGGHTEMIADGGTIHVAGNADLFADGIGGGYLTNNPASQGGDGFGGESSLEASNGGTISIGGATNVTAAGVGGNNAAGSESSDLSGSGTGGDARVLADSGGTITFGQAATVSASGYGGDNDSPTGRAGDGRGGNVDLTITGGSITANHGLFLYADGYGGTGQTAGDAYGGITTASISDDVETAAALHVGDEFRVEASGHGGDGVDNADGAGGDGGTGYAGWASFDVSSFAEAPGGITVNLANTFVDNNGNGGNGGDGLTGGNGGVGCGSSVCSFTGEGWYTGVVTVDLSAGTITTQELQAFSTARGGQGGSGSAGAGGNGGDAYGGLSTLVIGTDVTSTTASSYDRAFAGNGGAGTTTQGNGGYASGGEAQFEIWQGGHFTGNADVNTSAFGGAGNVGGDADGGYSSLDVEGAMNAGFISVNADATGGAGMTGGDGSAGTAIFDIFGGHVTASAHTGVSAIGTGGNGFANATGAGGVGGDAFGGTASIYGYGSDVLTLDAEGPQVALSDVTVITKAQGGNGGGGLTGGAGGSGEAGDSSMSLSGGLSMTTGDVEVFARGVGGNGGTGSDGVGGNGGSATGGSGSLWVDAGSSLSGNLYLGMTNASGGAGGTGTSGRGDGGSGQSGYDSAHIDGTVTFDGTAEGFNGFIVTSYAEGGAGGVGGSATAGQSSIYVSGSLTVTGQIQASAQAGGANGDTAGGAAEAGYASISVPGNVNSARLAVLNNATGGSGADSGGAARGGNASVDVDAGGTLQVMDTNVQATATGGGSATQGGQAEGGSTSFVAYSGDATIGGALALDASATGGTATTGAGGFAIGGEAFVGSYDGGQISGGDLTMAVNATGGSGLSGSGAAAAGHIEFDAGDDQNVSSIAVHNVTLNAIGTGSGTFEGPTGGGFIDISPDGNGTITADSVTANANGTFNGGFITISAGEFGQLPANVQFGSVDATANGSQVGGVILINAASGSTVNLGEATLTANGGFGGTIALTAGFSDTCVECGDFAAAVLPASGGIAADNLTMNAGSNISIALSGGADVVVTGTLQGNAGSIISLIDDGTGGAIRAHEVDLTAINIFDNADIIADIINFTTSSSMDLGDLSATDAISLTAGGDLSTGDLSAGDALTLTSGGSIETGNLDANAVVLDAAGMLSVGNVDAHDSADFTAGTLAQFNGIVSSPLITVTSADLDVTDGASLGVHGVTEMLTLNAVSSGLPIVIGDDGSEDGGVSGQYHLNEDGDIYGDEIVINAIGAGEGLQPDVNVFDVLIEGSQTPGGGNHIVTLNTGGTVRVLGLVGFTDAAADDMLSINAGHAIEVNTDTSGIQITDAQGHLSGILELNADNVWVGNEALLTQLENDPNFSGRGEALLNANGTPTPDGFVRAGTVRVDVADTLLVQNSGSADLFGGIDTGEGGLSVTNTGQSPATVVAFGRQTRSDGTVVTNLDFLASVETSGQAGFTDDSAVNGCTLGGSCGQPEEPPAPPPGVDSASILGPLGGTDSPSDLEDKNKDDDNGEGDEGDGSAVDPNLRLINTTPINQQFPIDDPVTSGGDVVVGNP